MADKVALTGPIEPDSQARVAFDLAKMIAYADTTEPKDRAYWITLYAECLRAVRGT